MGGVRCVKGSGREMNDGLMGGKLYEINGNTINEF